MSRGAPIALAGLALLATLVAPCAAFADALPNTPPHPQPKPALPPSPTVPATAATEDFSVPSTDLWLVGGVLVAVAGAGLLGIAIVRHRGGRHSDEE